MPSKELLSEVMEREVKDGIGRIVINDNTLTFAYADEDMWADINIHELQSKMKKFALENGYWIDSNLGFVSVGGNGSRNVCKTFNGYDLKMSESELVTEACEWIMKESR